MDEYWKSYEELKSGRRQIPSGDDPQEGHPVMSIMDDDTLQSVPSRRDFLKLFGFSVASAAFAASCEMPVRKAIPYLVRPEEVIPGKANYYASTFYDGNDYNSILVKVRDGRPIKIEGNDQSSVSQGKTSARTQASLLGLYDVFP